MQGFVSITYLRAVEKNKKQLELSDIGFYSAVLIKWCSAKPKSLHQNLSNSRKFQISAFQNKWKSSSSDSLTFESL